MVVFMPGNVIGKRSQIFFIIHLYNICLYNNLQKHKIVIMFRMIEKFIKN